MILRLTCSWHPTAGCLWGTLGQAADCTRTSAQPAHWNALVYGLKEWVVIQPDTARDSTSRSQCSALPRARTSEDEFYARARETSCLGIIASLVQQGRFAALAPCTLHRRRLLRRQRFPAHDAVHPATRRHRVHTVRLQHAVLNRKLSVAVTHNFVCPDGKSSAATS